MHPPPRVEKTFQSQMVRYCHGMFVRLGNCLLIVALIGVTGGHWAVLQTIAWTKMLADNLQTATLEAALTKTFDGKHPCKLCKSIDAGKRAEKKADLPLEIKKLEFVSQCPVFVFSAPQDFRLVPVFASISDGLTHRPSVPPPRSFTA